MPRLQKRGKWLLTKYLNDDSLEREVPLFSYRDGKWYGEWWQWGFRLAKSTQPPYDWVLRIEKLRPSNAYDDIRQDEEKFNKELREYLEVKGRHLEGYHKDYLKGQEADEE